MKRSTATRLTRLVHRSRQATAPPTAPPRPRPTPRPAMLRPTRRLAPTCLAGRLWRTPLQTPLMVHRGMAVMLQRLAPRPRQRPRRRRARRGTAPMRRPRRLRRRRREQRRHRDRRPPLLLCRRQDPHRLHRHPRQHSLRRRYKPTRHPRLILLRPLTSQRLRRHRRHRQSWSLSLRCPRRHRNLLLPRPHLRRAAMRAARRLRQQKRGTALQLRGMRPLVAKARRTARRPASHSSRSSWFAQSPVRAARALRCARRRPRALAGAAH